MRRVIVALCVGMLTGSAVAHHAMEYIEMESYSTARRGESVLHLHYDYMVDDADNPDFDHWEFTPGVSYGVTDRLMLDIHTHFAGFGIDHVVEEQRATYEPNGPSPFMEAVAGSLQYRLVEDWLVDIAVAATLEVPFSRAETLLGSEDIVVAGMLIIGKDLGEHSNITLNLGYEEEGDEHETSWALGVKAPISADPHGIAAGVEIMGNFENAGDNWSILPGVYMPIGSPNITLKTGLEFGKADGADALRANVTMMYRF
ncbi:MAG: hypothetical protein ISS31_01340 [Kiritimatiellae bacterium]|nr:hypothetical protein [Kiritimatiellia bacterium]